MQIAVEQGLNSSQAMYSISPLLVFVFLLFLLPDASLLKGSPRPLFWTSSACVYHYLREFNSDSVSHQQAANLRWGRLRENCARMRACTCVCK